MFYFRDLDPEEFRDTVVLLDLDGTLVPDGERTLAPAEAQVLAGLAKVALVYLISNKGYDRAPQIAEEYSVEAIVTHARKPSLEVISGVALPPKMRVVIGDKAITDGWFAHRAGAKFFKVERLTNGRESLLVLFSYAVDAVVWAFINLFVVVKRSSLWQYLVLARPRQWVKNILIVAPLFFAGHFFEVSLLLAALFGIIAFSAAASAGYVINDILDVDDDQRHHRKSKRPIASEAVSVPAALAYTFFLTLIAAWAAIQVPAVVPWVIVYFVLTYAYSLFLKRMPVVELVVVPLFYLIRILAGGAVVAVPISGWLTLTTLFASFFVVAGKRSAEALQPEQRPALRGYPPEFLIVIPAFGGALTMIAYALYSLLGSTHPGILYSNIFVLFGVLWYLRSVYRGDSEDPEAKLWRDLTLLGTVGLWGLYLLGVLYQSDITSFLHYLWHATS